MDISHAGAYAIKSIRPEYYGLLLFQQAAPGTSQLLPVSVQANANLKAWATMDTAGVVGVTMINKDQGPAGSVALNLAGYGVGHVLRLEAPSLEATTGVTLGGQTFDGSADGTLQGALVQEAITPEADVYTIPLPPVSAALLTLSPS